MLKQKDTSSKSLLCSDNKDKHYSTQIQVVYEYLQTNVATNSMIAEATGIKEKHICRHKRKLEKAGKLFLVKRVKCKSTGCKAWYLTTNIDFVPKLHTQLSLAL